MWNLKAERHEHIKKFAPRVKDGPFPPVKAEDEEEGRRKRTDCLKSALHSGVLGNERDMSRFGVFVAITRKQQMNSSQAMCGGCVYADVSCADMDV